jgi:hypothetical protein
MNLGKEILVLEEQGKVIFMSSKCASTSIRNQARFDLGYGDNLQYVTDLKDLLVFQNLGFNFFWVVRKPMDRLVSIWRDKVYRHLYGGFADLGFEAGMPFEVFIRTLCRIPDLKEVDSHLWPQTYVPSEAMDFLVDNGKQHPLFLIKMEELDAGWPKDLPRLKKDNIGTVKKEQMTLSLEAVTPLFYKYLSDFVTIGAYYV